MDSSTALSQRDGTLDAVLRLLDRQLIDCDGALAGKVDDLELLVSHNGHLVVSGLLCSVPALLPRFGSRRHGEWLLERWRRLGPTRADRTTPDWIDVADIAGLDSAVHLRRPRDRIAVPQPPGRDVRRLDELLGMEVDSTGAHVLDVRLSPGDGLGREPVRVVGLIVGRGRPGSFFGYERSPRQGPWLVAHVIGWLHRHTTYLPWEQVERIAWGEGLIQCMAPAEPGSRRDQMDR